MKLTPSAPVLWHGFIMPLALLALFAVAGFVPGILGRYELEIGYRLMLCITLAEAWNLLAGFGGLVSLGSAAFIGVGAYVFTGALNSLGVDPLVGLFLGGLAGSVLAFVVSPAVFRMRGLYFTVGTLALGEALRLFMVNVPWFGGARGLFLDASFPSRHELFGWALAIMLVAQIAVTGYTQSRLSIILRSVRDDEDAASQLGVRTFRVKLLVFGVASFIMGLAGGLQAFKLGAVEPYGIFGLQWSVDILAMVVIGGLGMRWGAVVGAVVVIALAEFLADYPSIHIILTGVFLIIVIRFAPKGLCGLAMSLWRKFQGTATGELS
ncbi:hypothetical protein GOZ90_25615 [Agrobacterium vitis]|uniref:Branched-chain amino acid ABC transporter permease n=1 Tax=Agrobacterium vitis TaxID=373 RepID=A0A6L6VJQ3_AGRVI|nr:branched-chain amino acid ABC transporter permease [Agrobacterium vitis]MUZ76030.1 hypothetical protein [Agrobacterium vitis]